MRRARQRVKGLVLGGGMEGEGMTTARRRRWPTVGGKGREGEGSSAEWMFVE